MGYNCAFDYDPNNSAKNLGTTQGPKSHLTTQFSNGRTFALFQKQLPYQISDYEYCISILLFRAQIKEPSNSNEEI